MTDSSQIAKSASGSNAGTRLAFALVGVLLLVLALNQFGGRVSTVEPEPGNAATTSDPAEGVILSREGHEGALSIVVPIDAETSVLAAMQRAAETSSDWSFAYLGSGAAAFLTELGGKGNEGAAGRNWQYEINGSSAEVSFGVQMVKPGDRVLWKFAAYE